VSRDFKSQPVDYETFLFSRRLRFALTAAYLHARRAQQPVSHLVPATVFSRHRSVAFGLYRDGIDRLVQFRVEERADRRDRFYARSRERALEVAHCPAHAVQE
jgi:hypothetical protein